MNDKVKEAIEEALCAWQNKADNIDRSDNFTDEIYLKGISDFKQALKRDIEKRKDKYFISDQQMDSYKYTECIHMLELLDTCKP